MQALPIRRPSPYDALDAARRVAGDAAHRASSLDEHFSFPAEDVATLAQAGLLLAPLPVSLGGDGLATGERAAALLPDVLRVIGAGSLALGRLYEGHVNAVALVARHGTAPQLTSLAHEVRDGDLLGVWNTDDAKAPLRLVGQGDRWDLKGRKILCSGAGFIARAIVTARDPANRLLMVMPRLAQCSGRVDMSSWRPTGMRASATGEVDFTGITVEPGHVVGGDGDYHCQPSFSGGAWRFAAVHLGGMEALLGECRRHLVRTDRADDPHQRARIGQATIAVETARLWVQRAADIAEKDVRDASSVVAYVNLARLAVERAALDLIEHVQRSVGLAAFIQPNPMERIARDLATYLRQPAPDRALTEAAGWVLNSEDAIGELWV